MNSSSPSREGGPGGDIAPGRNTAQGLVQSCPTNRGLTDSSRGRCVLIAPAMNCRSPAPNPQARENGAGLHASRGRHRDHALPTLHDGALDHAAGAVCVCGACRRQPDRHVVPKSAVTRSDPSKAASRPRRICGAGSAFCRTDQIHAFVPSRERLPCSRGHPASCARPPATPPTRHSPRAHCPRPTLKLTLPSSPP
jgi:hypothetical protein